MNITNKLLLLTVDNILSVITPADIYSYYLKSKDIFDVAISSPFREDKNPSFLINSRNYFYKDFATGEFGNCFNFVKKLYNLNFNEALRQIVFDLEITDKFIILNKKPKETKRVDVNISYSASHSVVKGLKVKVRPFNEDDLKYWNSYGISLPYLKLGRVYAISHFFINGITVNAQKYAYVFIEKKDGVVTYKVYQPYSKNFKWLSCNNNSIWELWDLLPKEGSNLIITSSRKDALSIIENLKIPATALQGESVIPKPHIMQTILKRFKAVYLLYDNDIGKEKNWGQEHAKKICETYNINNLVIPDSYNAKDFSDLVYKYGRADASNVIKKFL